MLNSMFMAFSLYSRIPVPQAKWNEKNMRYCICFLPLVGAVIGAVQAAAFLLLSRLSCGAAFRGALLTALPVFLSGGIHLDGFLDTCDAIHSWKEPEERLRILKDPHAGAFAVLGGILYFLLDFAVWTEAGQGEIPVLCLCFVLSRALSAWTALVFPKARKDGMLRQETDPAGRGAAAAAGLVCLLTGAAMLFPAPVQGLAAVLAALAVTLYYRHMSQKLFGGITGDLSGWFTQVSELAMAIAVIICAGFQT